MMAMMGLGGGIGAMLITHVVAAISERSGAAHLVGAVVAACAMDSAKVMDDDIARLAFELYQIPMPIQLVLVRQVFAVSAGEGRRGDEDIGFEIHAPAMRTA